MAREGNDECGRLSAEVVSLTGLVNALIRVRAGEAEAESKHPLNHQEAPAQTVRRSTDNTRWNPRQKGDRLKRRRLGRLDTGTAADSSEIIDVQRVTSLGQLEASAGPPKMEISENPRRQRRKSPAHYIRPPI